MTLGRTPAGAIKIKTDSPGLRAVNCACCGGGCECGYATPINPPSDPDFTKKLHGDDPSVTPFTSVSGSFSFATGTGYEDTQSGSFSGQWLEGSGGEYCPANITHYLNATSCWDHNGCGWNLYCNFPNLANVSIHLTDQGCLFVAFQHDLTLSYFHIIDAGDCGPDNVTSITINGVSYSTKIYSEPWGGAIISGTATITFS